MASLIIETGSNTHPTISIDAIDLASEAVTFHWIGGPYAGDCSEPFTVSLADHGTMTLNELAQAVAAHMISLLPAS